MTVTERVLLCYHVRAAPLHNHRTTLWRLIWCERNLCHSHALRLLYLLFLMTLLGGEGSQNLANKSQWAFGSVPFLLLSLPLGLVCSRLGMSLLQRLTKQILGHSLLTPRSSLKRTTTISLSHFNVVSMNYGPLYKNAQLFISPVPTKRGERKKKWCGLFSGIRLHSLNNRGHVDG